MSIQRPDPKWCAHGSIVGVDFETKVIEFAYQGDLQPLVRGRYALVPADTLRMLSMRLQAAESASSSQSDGRGL